MIINAYEVTSLSKRYTGPKGVLANDNINLSIKIGEILGIFGPNGAGKTTLVRQLMALSRPTSGTVKLFRTDIISHPHYVPEKVAYFAQETYYFWHLTSHELLYFTGRLRGLNHSEAKKQSLFLLEKFFLTNKITSRLAHLSFGEATFVSLLSVFMGYWPVVVLDEPTSRLDPVRSKDFWDYLWEINSRLGTTVLLVTHNVLEAEKVVHRVVIIDSGKLIALGTPAELKRGMEDVVRIEVEVKNDGLTLPEISHSTQLPSKRNHFFLQTNKSYLEVVNKELHQKLGLENIASLKILTPTLEDVYINLVGKEWK
ncbi:MAG: Daunorubicin/doxorubicin resistance ATP-binding protein DrrA [candidate division WS2 bacterium]|nr:Daunorubicin/doxorubicin resistance ATP-binding protein DrrA [Candidatus Lithacetigena glycinireducens]MBT9175148.1 Daunorubicin/doxorubicin resistance ATP-binding protein DrrA [Candidatus Lithacetigena glycinireducens]